MTDYFHDFRDLVRLRRTESQSGDLRLAMTGEKEARNAIAVLYRLATGNHEIYNWWIVNCRHVDGDGP